MLDIYAINFNLIEWIAVTGLAQGILTLVYIILRARHWRQASVAIGYFLVLTAAFGLQFALRLEDYEEPIRLMMWLCWSLGPPLCYLLVVQIARGADIPPRQQFWVLALVPLALGAGFALRDGAGLCRGEALFCPVFFHWLYWLGSLTGGIAMLALWGHRDLFGRLWKIKSGRERYWLVMVLVLANVVAVGVNFLRSVESLNIDEADALLAILGLAFLYLASTALFRVYPPPVALNATPRLLPESLTPEEQSIADQVRKLMEVEKLYHEPMFSRADLAREVHTSENTLSRVINVSFGKSFPKMLNEFRIEDAKRMLQNPEIPIQVIAFEVGFNSLASFNRAFREITGDTPSGYRAGTSGNGLIQ